jgi:hypothetical protein
MVFPEGLQQGLVRDLLRVEDHQHDLVMPRAARAGFLIGGVGGRAARVARSGDPDPLPHLPELALRAPEAAKAEQGLLHAVRVRGLEGAVVDKMALRRGKRRGAARKSLIGRGQVEPLAETEHGGTLS